MRGLALAAGLALVAGPAFALDAGAFSDALVRMPEGLPEVSIEHGEPEVEGSTIVLPDLAVVYPPEMGQNPMRLGDVTFEGVEALPDGAYRYSRAIGGAAVANLSEEDYGANFTFSVDGWRIENGYLPHEGEVVEVAPNGAIGGVYDRLVIDRSQTAFPVGVIFLFEETVAEFDWRTSPRRFTASGDLTADISGLFSLNEDVAAFLEANDLAELMGRQIVETIYDPAAGNYQVSIDTAFDRIGTLRQEHVFTGATPTAIARLYDMPDDPADPDDEAAITAETEQLLDILGSIQLGTNSLAFVDDGLTEALLDFAAERTGSSVQALRSIAAGSVPVGVGAMGVPSLITPSFEAVDTFLRDPGSFRIAIEPEAPVSVNAIVDAAEDGPGAVVDLLNVVVKANEPEANR